MYPSVLHASTVLRTCLFRIPRVKVTGSTLSLFVTLPPSMKKQMGQRISSGTTREGLKACKTLSDDDVSVNMTLVFSAGQAILCAKAGASYVSPFVGRLNDQYWDGINLIEEIADLYATHCVKTQVLAASIREVRQVPACFRVGADVCTLPYDIFQKLYDHTLTDSGLAKFDADWKALTEKL